MNLITVEGGKKEQRQIVEDVVSYMIQRQMPRMKTLDIHVILKKIDDAYGYCMSESNREFEIEVDKRLGKNQFISTVIHEMVHVWQYATKQLTQKGCKEFWRGTDYTDAYYSNQPWERQALRMEKSILKEYKRDTKT
tara:strand:+ start:168 stop:578 length:411 start_codon:yes stop_codon:yes gene_type:complete